MSGYVEGPTLRDDEDPWPLRWESSVNESCAHVWERVTLLAGPRRWQAEQVIRCRLCRVPRCGHSNDADPCMERRHHDGLHIYLSGRYEPLGGILR